MDGNGIGNKTEPIMTLESQILSSDSKSPFTIDSNASMLAKMVDPVMNLQNQIRHLLSGWDDHPALQKIVDVIDMILYIPMNTLLPKVIDKYFGFDTVVEEAQGAINVAHVEVESVENGVGVVKLIGLSSMIHCHFATLASRDVDCCLIPESPFYLEGQGGLFEFIQQRLKENGHVVIVLAEGTGQEYVSDSVNAFEERDASGNKLLIDIGQWLTHKIKNHFATVKKMAIHMKYIDPTYMIHAIPSNAYDNIYCTLLAQSAVHGAMARFSGFTVGPVNSRHAYIPILGPESSRNHFKAAFDSNVGQFGFPLYSVLRHSQSTDTDDYSQSTTVKKMIVIY
ncbi:unnamed protein product [Lactuca saligna]|uniref:Phosphofructokinase domain-containing protein n=1 Tax=Lactuca saligna TaxID=75948 RepID=A0AA35Z8S0_LACSI|nr:unnamed protein product [Lactuca saligna]